MQKLNALLATLFLGAAVAACGGPEQPSAQGQAFAAPASAATPIVSAGRKVEIIANDTMKFDRRDPRQGRRAAQRHARQPGHDAQVLDGPQLAPAAAEADVDAFLSPAAESPTTDYVPAAQAAEILASTKLLGPGERTRRRSPRPRAGPLRRSCVRSRATPRSACVAC